MANFFTKFFKAVASMVKTGKPETTPTPTPTPTAAASRSRSRPEQDQKVINRREYDRWDRFENDFEDVESLGESEYDETT